MTIDFNDIDFDEFCGEVIKEKSISGYYIFSKPIEECKPEEVFTWIKGRFPLLSDTFPVNIFNSHKVVCQYIDKTITTYVDFNLRTTKNPTGFIQ